MKFENYLSFKKVLRIAMPCLALSFFFASCSNEEATIASDETSVGANLTLTATVPVAKQSFSTRLGIADDRISDDNGVDEPYIWIEGEKLTLYWKNLLDSNADKVIEYEIKDVTPDGQNCKMTPVNAPLIANGFYKIHALSPHTSFNFVGNELKATIDLGNQNQPNDAINHAYIGDKMYQYATTVVQIHGGNIVSGTTNLPFEFITSLFRVRVVNNTGLPINVNKVKLSYSSANNTQFYSKGIFTAADPVGSHSYAATADAITNDLSITTNKSLAVDENFDAYMSFFPTDGYNAGSSEILNVEVEYDVNGTPGTFIRTPSVNASIFQTGPKYLSFESGDRYFLTLTITGDDLPDGVSPEPPIDADIVEYAGFQYTFNRVIDGVVPFYTVDNFIFISYDQLPSACPNDWDLFSLDDLENTDEARALWYSAMGADFRGRLTSTEQQVVPDRVFLYGEANKVHILLSLGWIFTDITITIPGDVNFTRSSGDVFYYKPICRRRL